MNRCGKMIWYYVLLLFCSINKGHANLPPVFTEVLNSLTLSEGTPIGTNVGTLAGYDPEGGNVTYKIIGTDHFKVDPISGVVTLVQSLDHEKEDVVKFLVSIKDKVEDSDTSNIDNDVQVPASVIVLDENDNPPVFQNLPYDVEVLENSLPGLKIFDQILVTDVDTVGDELDIKCDSETDNSDICKQFLIEIVESNENTLKANVILNTTLNYNERTIYHFLLVATDGVHSTKTTFEVRVKDIQNKPPVFYGSLSSVVDEDSPIGTMVLKIQARDGDTGEPRKIIYDLLTNPMDYFLLDYKTGELRTAKPLDKEALLDATGLIKLSVRAREVVDGIPVSENGTETVTQVSVTIRDVNDSPPMFNKKEYDVSIYENTPPGTPLSLDMNVTDKDVGINSIFSLRLNDVSGVFEVEPRLVRSFSQVNIRVSNGTLDYENPNQRKFIVLVIAEETNTEQKLSSTATVTISVIDTNDNKPLFDQDSYMASVSEAADFGQHIITITAKDKDSGSFGDAGIRYSLSGTGAELFLVNETTGAISLENCNLSKNLIERRKRDVNNNAVNVTANGQSGLISFELKNDPILEYFVHTNEDNEQYAKKEVESISTNINNTKKCLDYETETGYFLSYKATDDNGKGQSSVVSLKISVTDSNDSPPICESALYRASVDEGAEAFDSPLIIKARDVDLVSDINYSIIGDEVVMNLFQIDKKSGQVTIQQNAVLDVNNLKTDNLKFNVEANDGTFSTHCGVSITIRDVNNHAPQFVKKNNFAVIPENSEIGTFVEQLNAEDLDTGINAVIKYRIDQGSFNDFRIEKDTGKVFVSSKLDYDRRNTYQIIILATDSGTPSLSGTTTLTVSVTNSNDKDPYFTPKTQRAEAREDTAIGTTIYTLIAVDPDVPSYDSLEFAATEPITAINEDGNKIENVELLKDYFSINRNGKVVVNKQLDRKKFAVIQYTVLVTDSTATTIQQGKGALIISIVDVNELPPKFIEPWSVEDPVMKFQIVEEQPIGTVLTTLQAYDQESTIGEFNISSNPYFEINQTSGVIKTKSRIDFETIKEIKFSATVTDTGIPKLTSTAEIVVNVVNVNDNEPIFEQNEYYFNVTENSPAETIVGRVHAVDKDIGTFGEITYSLIGENSKYFMIDSSTGNIMVMNSSVLDYEKFPSIELSVMAIDKAANTQQKFATAKLFINILDVNDNQPMFLQNEYFSKVPENAQLDPPAALLQVKASDLDHGIFGKIKYSIVSGNDLNLFKLDEQSGIIYPMQSLQGKKGNYNIMIEARDMNGDGPYKSTAYVNIEVQEINQYRPEFIIPASSNATVEIPEDIVKANHLIMTVKAIDNDTGSNGKVNYYLQVNNQNVEENDEFIIDKISGELRTKEELKRKSKSKYDLILVARDQGFPSQFEILRFLTVFLIDGNENRPEFSEQLNPYKISMNENSGRDVRIGKVQATFRNKQQQPIYYYMILGNEDGAFYLDKTNGDIFTNKSLDRETNDFYTLYILASSKQDLHISDTERASFSIKTLDRDNSVAKVAVTVLDVNDNEPFFEKSEYFAGVNAKTLINGFVVQVNASDLDFGENAKIEYFIASTSLYKLGGPKLPGSLVPSPFAISDDGRITTATFVAEYNQDRFELEILAKEKQPPERSAKAKVNIWIFESSQLIRVILSRSPAEVHKEQEEIVAELKNATQHRIIVDEIRYHVDSMGRIRMDWCDLFFHAVDRTVNQQIVPVDVILKVIDANYDYLRDYYAGFAIENVVPAHFATTQEEFDLTLASLAALIIVLFVGVISFIVLCCCLKHWNLTIPMENKRKETLIKKQIIEDLNTTENPLWIEQKLKLYEEQELTMQVFSEPEPVMSPEPVHNKDLFEHLNTPDNTYATIQSRNDRQLNEIDDYATLRNNRVPSTYEFTGSTFQAPIREQDDAVAELI